MKRDKLPLGVQNFPDFKKYNYIYVDKTELIHRLVTGSQYNFLSRPRRFGKSLLVSTIQELFMGHKEHFENLWIYDKWDWSKTHPVIHLSFSSFDYQGYGLKEAISVKLKECAKNFGITLTNTSHKAQFEELIKEVYAQKGDIVILIDEYDKPIIDYLEKEKMEQAKANRDILKTFYSVLKDASIYIRLLFITGVSKFSKVSIFSDLNHLTDLTLEADYATLTGYTQSELEFYFPQYIDALQQRFKLERTELIKALRTRYDGFSWDGQNFVYNPFGTLNALSKREFGNFWFDTGTPTFLIKLMTEQVTFDFEQRPTSTDILNKYDLDNLDLVALLFQTGYLTIKKRNFFNREIELDYPNEEVRSGLYEFTLDSLIPSTVKDSSSISVRYLNNSFLANDLDRVKMVINTIFSDLPSNLYERDDQNKLKEMALAERFFHGTIHLIFKYLGLYIESEVATSQGRLDSVVITPTHIYIFEFKYNRSGTAAMNQLKKNNYADKYRSFNKKIVGIGVNFSHYTRKINGWIVKELSD
jgi:Predicted AAA-ATPase/PD-(D/E)XK nuclease superfamily